ncbi:unnamed protein product [Effrenium voratum]|nr:unnamed protein product [Effrenium voratum]
MEVLVTDAFGLPDDCLVSIRYGTTRRQAPLESVRSQPFKFPTQLDELSEPLKIDVLKPLVSTRLVLHPHEEQYGIGFDHEEEIAMGLHVRATTGAEPGAKESNGKDSASSAKDYLEQNGLLKYVQSLLHAVIQDKPQDPFAYMIEQLTAAKSKSSACERVLSRPTSAVHRPSGARPASARPTPPRAKPVPEGPPAEEPPIFPTVDQVPEVAQQVPAQAEVEAEDKERAEESQKALQELDRCADIKQGLLQKMTAAAGAGELEAVLTAVGLDHSRTRIQSLLEQSAETGELEAALKRTLEHKDAAAVDKVKTQLRDALLSANESGKLLQVMEGITADGGKANALELQRQLRSSLVDANEAGEALKEMDGMWAKKEADAQEIARLKSRLRAALQATNNTGQMRQVLEGMTTAREADEKEAERIKCQLKQVLLDANKSGKMLQVLQEITTEQEEAEKLHCLLREALQSANESGQMLQALEETTAKKIADAAEAERVQTELRDMLLTANESGRLLNVLQGASFEVPDEEVGRIKGQLRDVLLDANKTGKMEEVLSEMCGAMPPARECDAKDEMVRKLLEATESGQLLTILQEISPQKGPAAAAAGEVAPTRSGSDGQTKAKMRDAMLAAAKSGKLTEVLDELEPKAEEKEAVPAVAVPVAAVPVGPAPSSEVEVLRSNVREKMQESLASGRLEEGLSTLAQKQQKQVEAPTKAEAKAETRVPDELAMLGKKICNVLQEASSSGKLEEALELLKEEQQAVIRSTPEDELEAVRSNLCLVVQDALESGKLESALGEVRKPADVATIQAKFRKLLREALESGTLATRVALLKTKVPAPPSEPPPSEMDMLKSQLRQALQHAAEAGHLAEALATLRGQGQAVDTTQLRALTEAALTGTLDETISSLKDGLAVRSPSEAVDPPPLAGAEGAPPPEASPAADEVAYGTQGMEEKELEALRGRLRGILEVACDQGILEQAVQVAVKKNTEGEAEADSADLQAKLTEMREESKTLYSTVERLKIEKEELERANKDLASRLSAPST